MPENSRLNVFSLLEGETSSKMCMFVTGKCICKCSKASSVPFVKQKLLINFSRKAHLQLLFVCVCVYFIQD